MKRQARWWWAAAVLVVAGCGGGGSDTTTTTPVTDAGTGATVAADVPLGTATEADPTTTTAAAWSKHPAGFISLSLVDDWTVPEFDGNARTDSGAYAGVNVEKVLSTVHPVRSLAKLEIYRQRKVAGAPDLAGWGSDVIAQFTANGMAFAEPTDDTVGGQPASRFESTEPAGRVVIYALAVGPERLAIVLTYDALAKDGLKAVVEGTVDSISFDLSALAG